MLPIRRICCIRRLLHTPDAAYTRYTLHTSSADVICSSADVICCIGCTVHPPPHGRNILSSVKLAVTPVNPERTDNFVNLGRSRQMSWGVRRWTINGLWTIYGLLIAVDRAGVGSRGAVVKVVGCVLGTMVAGYVN
jgi:hypothetical protein